MLKKSPKALFVDRTDFYVLAARASSDGAPLVIEEIREFSQPPTETDFRLLAQVKGNALTKAHVSVAPSSRFLRRVTLEGKRMREVAPYVNEVLEQQVRADPLKTSLHVLGASDGLPADLLPGPANREVVFCGASMEELATIQDQWLASSVYPERMEISSVSTVGGLLSYLRNCKIEGAVLVLEVLADQTHVQILTAQGIDVTRSLPTGYNSFLPVVKTELGLRDEESARKVFFSNSFDFTMMGAQLIRKLVRELQSAVGFYEVQTGHSISQVFMSMLPTNLKWLSKSFAEGLGVTAMEIDFAQWLPKAGISLADASVAARLDNRWLPLFALMVDAGPAPIVVQAKPTAAS